ncbi:lectin-related protein [Quercus suber]|uniref:Lectin-related protein n=1 Tax=Quercus suber TaxID=58331 RepID=A0AAW0KKP0_QUESU
MALSNTLPSCLFQPQKLQSLLFFFLLLLPPLLSISFNLTSFNDTYINFTGDAFSDSDGYIQVTEVTRQKNITDSVGRATYKEPVRLWENRTGRLTDFTTHFSFKIEATSTNAAWSADGLAFFITPNDSNVPLNKTKGGALGLLDIALDNSTQNEIVAVEFDTFKNYFDPSDNHVGIDVNSVKSKANVTWPRSIISNGETVNAWVSYNSTTQNLSVFLTYAINSVSNNTTSLFYIVNLKDVLPEWVSVGFSAATGAGTEFHTILSWSFSSTLEVEDRSRKNNLGLGIGLAVSSAVVCCALGVLWFIFRRRRASRNTQDLGWEQCVIHRDIKSSNIMLDSNFNAKLVGLWCCHPDPTIRPSIRQVIHVLNFEAPLPNLPSKFPIPMYFGSSMHLREFSNTSPIPTVSEDQTQFSGSSCSINSSMLAGSSNPLLNLGKADVELTSITH